MLRSFLYSRFLPGVDGAAGGQGPAHSVGAEGDDEEEDVALPVWRLAAQQLHIRPEHRVEKGVRATEADLHDGGGRDVSVAILLQPGHQAGQRGPHVRRPRGANDLPGCSIILAQTGNSILVTDRGGQFTQAGESETFFSLGFTLVTVSDNLEARCEACGSPVLARII